MWEQLSQAGISATLDSRLAKRIRLCNQVSVAMAGVVLAHALLLLALGYSMQAAVLGVVFAALAGVVLLAHRQQFVAARGLHLLTGNATILYFSSVLGTTAGTYYIFFFVAVLPWLLFSRRETFCSIVATLTSIALFFYVTLSSPPATVTIDATLATLLYIAACCTTFTMLIFAVALFRTESSTTEKALSKDNEALQEIERQLQATVAANNAVVAFTQVMYNNSQTLEDLCHAGLRFVIDRMKGAYGAVLLYDKNTDDLVLTAETGFNSNDRRPLRIKNGETLTGDTFARQQMMRMYRLSSTYWHSHSGLGSSAPKVLCIVPMTFKSPAGILEIAFMEEPGEADIDLLERLSTAFAAHVLALAGSIENAALITELQQQKDEVEHSYHELNALKQTAAARMQEQYTAQQTLIKQILDKGKKKEDELTTRIKELEHQLQQP